MLLCEHAIFERQNGRQERRKKTENKTNNNRGITWPDTATIALLYVWQEEVIRLSLENSKSLKKMRYLSKNHGKFLKLHTKRVVEK